MPLQDIHNDRKSVSEICTSSRELQILLKTRKHYCGARPKYQNQASKQENKQKEAMKVTKPNQHNNNNSNKTTKTCKPRRALRDRKRQSQFLNDFSVGRPSKDSVSGGLGEAHTLEWYQDRKWFWEGASSSSNLIEIWEECNSTCYTEFEATCRVDELKADSCYQPVLLLITTSLKSSAQGFSFKTSGQHLFL